MDLWSKAASLVFQGDGAAIPLLLRLIEMAKPDSLLQPTHLFAFARFMEALDVFSDAAGFRACKVVVRAVEA